MVLERGASLEGDSFERRSREMRHSSKALRVSGDLDMPESQHPGLDSDSSRKSLASFKQHKITIGKPDAAAVSLLEEVPKDRQLTIDYKHVEAWVPSMAPTSGGWMGIPFLPDPTNCSLPTMPWNKKKEKNSAPKAGSDVRQVLFNINGCCKPGEVLALMGPSGSGKTTLLSIVGARAQKALTRTGKVTFNGTTLNKRLKRQIGYVMQDDLLYESLTVYETLYYAAMLRLPRHMSEDAKKERVNTVITALGIESCKDTIIGGFFRKGISGGERKRASVGHELLINPSILLLDEPTSGLDSTTAMHLLATLRDLAQGGRAIVTTIHQPSSRLFQQLDKLLLLSKGHALYYGRAGKADEWFDRLGYRLPYKVNVADFILDLSSADVYTENRDGEESRQYLISICEKFLASHVMDGYDPDRHSNEANEVVALRTSFSHRRPETVAPKVQNSPNDFVSSGSGIPEHAQFEAGRTASGNSVGNGHAAHGLHTGPDILGDDSDTDDEHPRNHGSRESEDLYKTGASDVGDIEMGTELSSRSNGKSNGRRTPVGQQPADGFQAIQPATHNTPGGIPQAKASRWGASYPQQLRILFIRSIRTRRFQALSKQDMAQFLIVGVLTGLFWLQRANKSTVAAASDTLGLLFFEVLFLSFRQLFVALFTFPDEFKMLLKERASGMYRLSAFYFARTASDLPMDMAIPTLFLCIIYFMGGLRYTPQAFFTNYLTVILVMLVAQSYGLLLGTIVMNPKTAQTMAAIIMLTFVLTGGYFVRGIPFWISWFKYLSFVFYGYGLLTHIEFQGRTLYSCVEPGAAPGSPAASVDVSNPSSNPICTPITNIAGALGLQQDVNSRVWVAIDPCVLIATLIVIRILVYVALRKKTSAV